MHSPRDVPRDDAADNRKQVWQWRLTATDPNATDMSGTTNDTLTYTLGGRDAASFHREEPYGPDRSEAPGTKLDYEEAKKSYMVTVTATDPSPGLQRP